MGGEEYFENGICIIEWGEQIEEILPKDYTKITFSKSEENENYRELKIEQKRTLITFVLIKTFRSPCLYSCAKFAKQISVQYIYIIGSSENFPII